MAKTRVFRRCTRRRAPLPVHGTRARYQLGCHCTPCVTTNTAYLQTWRRGGQARARALMPAVLARRRVRELVAGGWRLNEIARELGVSRWWPIGACITVQRHRRLEALYHRRVAE